MSDQTYNMQLELELSEKTRGILELLDTAPCAHRLAAHEHMQMAMSQYLKNLMVHQNRLAIKKLKGENLDEVCSAFLDNANYIKNRLNLPDADWMHTARVFVLEESLRSAKCDSKNLNQSSE